MTDPYIEKLRRIKPQLSQMNIQRIRVFGSRLHGVARENSDLDLLIDFSKRPDLLELGEVYSTLEETLGCKVDIVQPHLIFEPLRDKILREARDV